MKAPVSTVEPSHDMIVSHGQRLHQITVAPSRPWASLAIVHGYGDHAGRHIHFMRWLADRGVGSVAVDFRGHGLSTGRHCVVRRWGEYLLDLSAMLAAARSTWPDQPLFVLGHSHGALIAAAAAIDGKLPCAGCILCSPYFDLRMPVSKGKRLLSVVASWIAPGLAVRSGVGGTMLSRDAEMNADTERDPFCRGIATPGWFVQSRGVQRQVRQRAADFTLPLLMLIAGEDQIADSAASIEFFNSVGSGDKTLRIYEGHRHELLRDLDRQTIFEEIVLWMKK
jgi:lysophospholipase